MSRPLLTARRCGLLFSWSGATPLTHAAQAMMGGAASNKKQREVYVGNLTIGAVTDVMLRELFNGALAHLMPNPELNPPVINVGMDPSGRWLVVLPHYNPPHSVTCVERQERR